MDHVAICEATERYPRLLPVLLQVEPATLQRRLVARGRETEEQIRKRLDRNARYAALEDSAPANAIMVVDNSGAADDAVRALYQHLYPFEYHHTTPSCN